MCTDCKNPIKSIRTLVGYALTTAIIALAIMLHPVQVVAQVNPINVNISVMPPYTSSLYDYINTPNKIVITLSHVMPTGTALELYLKASIISENGIKVTTQEGFKPSEPILLEPGKIYKLNNQNISDAFNINYIIIEGTDLNELLNGSGLPEDYYQICVQAFDYNTDQPLSADQPIGCSNIFNVTNLEPPMIITPLCGDTIVSSAIQTVQVNWNTPAGSLPGTEYLFEMVEMPENSFLDPKEAFDASAFPPFFEETTKLNSILLTIQKTVLNPGYTYAFRVRALDPSDRMHYRNNGYSEVCWFTYKQSTPWNLSLFDNSTRLVFLNPKKKGDTLNVNNENDFLLNWCWLDKNNSMVDDEYIANNNIEKYIVSIHKSGKGINNVSFSKELIRNSVDQLIPSYLQLTKEEALNIGLEDGQSYTATVDVFNNTNQLVKKAESPNFVFKIANDETPSINIPIQALINYSFESYPETFPVINSEVIVEVLSKPHTIQLQNTKYTTNHKQNSKQNTESDFINIASLVARTNSMGQLDTTISIPEQYLKTDSIAFSIKLANSYYVDSDFELNYLNPANGNLQVNFGTLTAKTYAYSLKLNVKKEFTNYKITRNESGVEVSLTDQESISIFGSSNQTSDQFQEHIYKVEKEGIADGIPVVLYRENKTENIPLYEGEITQSNTPSQNQYNNITVVAFGTTSLENDSTYVTFDKLLATNNNNENYYILAIPDLDSLIHQSNTMQNMSSIDGGQFVSIKNSELTPQVSQSIAGIIANFDQGSVLTNFVDSGKFIAEPMPFSLQLPAKTKTNKSYYRNVEARYTITSCMPPTSVLKGRLLYEWKTDEAHTKRPMSNTHFRVIVDYVDGDGKSIGSIQNTSNQAEGIISGHWESDYFVPEGSNEPMSLVDQYTTMAEGMTDSAGYFTIEVVNINQKGNLGSGYLQHNEGGSAPPIVGQSIKDKVLGGISGNEVINPAPYDYANMFGNNLNTIGNQQTITVQNTINSGTFNVGFDAGSQSFELGNTQAGAMNKAMGMVIQNDEFMGNAHGPNPGTVSSSMADDNTPPQYFEQFKRTYRIVIDGNKAPYFYPSQKVIDDVQAFESMAAPIDIPHYVKEFKLKVKTVEINDEQEELPLTQVQATIFRKGNKNIYLPLGEGDGKYTYAELLNPVYLNTGNNTSFEQLWPKQTVNTDGTTKLLGGLLQSEKYNYAIQASSFVNTGSKTYASTIVDMPTIIDNNLNWSNPVIPEDSVTIVLTPLPSRILVHVKDSLSGQPLGSSRNTRVQFSNLNIPYFWLNDLSAPVDNYGYLELFVDQAPLSEYFNNQTEQSNIYLTASAEGFNQPEALYKTTLRKLGTQATPTLSLLPAANITGRIIDADYQATNGQIIFNGVRAYIQADSSTIFETDNLGSFDMPIAPKAGVKVKIIPKDVAWFDTVYVLTAADALKKTIDIGELKVYRRKHRIQFNITQKMPPGFTGPPTPISGATVQLGPDVVASTANGIAKFEFENVSVNNYTFIVRGPQGEGYIPKTVNVTNTESRDFKYINIELEQGSQISGTVTLDGNAVKNARVYLEAYTSNTPMEHSSYSNILQNASSIITSNNTATSSNDMSLLEARTNAKGNFTIKGIPVNNQNINIIATLDTTFTVSGDKKTITISNGNGQANLSLTSFKDITVNKLFGFPLSVENITNVNATQIRVTGLVHWTEAISDFTLSDNNKLLRVENVLFNIVTGIGGKKTAVPVNNSIAIQGVTNLKMSYLGKYNVKLTSAEQTQAYNSTPLTLSKENDLGTISGKMQIVDNSFNYPSSYLNFDNSEFYLAKLNPDSTINNKVSVVTSAFTISESQSASYVEPAIYQQQIANKILNHQQKPASAYNLSNNIGGPIQFKLINFDATADPKNSFIDVYGKIHLDTRLICHIPNAQPENISVSIPDMVLDQNKVYPALAAKPITLKLEEWDLEARNWSFSTTEGGILSTNALLKTNIIDIPVKKFVLRNDMFFMDEFEYENLSMAGGKIKFDYIAQGCAHLNYEYKVGSDMKPHWNFSLLGSATGKVASLPPLNGLTNYDIDLNYVEILSNNEMIVQLMQKTNKAYLHNNPVAQFEPLSIFNGPSYIGVTGLLNTKAPRVSEILLTVNWNNTNQEPTFENVSVEFQGKGFVHFEANKKKIEIDENEVRIEGKVLEKPNLTFNPMPATFFAERNETYYVDIRKDWITQLSQKENLVNFSSPATSSVGYRLKIAKGGMQVINNDWGLLSYEGDMISNQTNAENIDPSYTKFEVLGEVKASTENLSISGINTPIGKMEQVYNFEAMEMRGSLNIDAPVTMGALTLNHGTIETLFDKNGFYVAGSCNAYLLAGLLTGTYNLGFLAGSYDKEAKDNLDKAWNITNSYINPKVVNTCYKTETLDANGLNGIYTTVNRQVLNTSQSFDFILASGYVRAEVLLGGDFYANFNQTATMGSDAFLFVDVGAGLSSISGTSISGGVIANAQFGTKLTLNPSSFEINGSLNMNFNGEISQSLGIETISKSFDVNCYVGATYNTQSGTEFDFNLGENDNKTTGCAPNTTPK